MKKQYLTHNLRQTQQTAKELVKTLLRAGPNKNAVIIGLNGDLGAGKTTFVQGFAKGLGIKEKILSPTFVIMKKFEIRKRECQRSREEETSSLRPLKFEILFHIDCYRTDNSKEILDLGFKEIIAEPKNIVIIEWADKIKKIIPVSINEAGKKRRNLFAPKNTIWIELKFIDTKTRKIMIR